MSDTALATSRPAPIEPWREPDWQRLWLALRAKEWRSLALIPAGPGAPPDFALRVAVMLSRTGMLHLGAPIQVADATRLPLANLSAFVEEVRRCATDGDLIVVALAALADNPVALSLAQSTDAAVLCVGLEQMHLSDARQTVAKIGAGRFLGSVMLHPAEPRAAKSR